MALQQLKRELEQFGERNDNAPPTRGSKMLNITRDTGELLAGCKGEWLVVSLSGE